MRFRSVGGKHLKSLWLLRPVPETDPRHTSVGNAVLVFPLHPQKVPKVPRAPAHGLVRELSCDAGTERTRPVLLTAGARAPRKWGIVSGKLKSSTVWTRAWCNSRPQTAESSCAGLRG